MTEYVQNVLSGEIQLPEPLVWCWPVVIPVLALAVGMLYLEHKKLRGGWQR